MDKLTLTTRETKFTLVPAPEEEHQYCFAHDNPLVQQACVGYLRGYFGDTEGPYHTSWFDQNSLLNSAAFKREFENIVFGLRDNGLLSDLRTMNARCNRFPDAVIKTQWRKEMAFRVETDHHTYFLRCIPSKGDYNFYFFCYDKRALMEVLRKQKGLPLVCWSRLKSTDEVIALKYGESGYYKWETSGYDGVPSEEIVDYLNETSGITKVQAAAMEAGSMFGWHCPASDPRNYEPDGRFRKDAAQPVKTEEVR
ncbi:MAG: hypothetical protein IJ412_10100 [Oscillospiraceae bacterium]|nr:hypothetical protein [Oscillospiraceae bacterium]